MRFVDDIAREVHELVRWLVETDEGPWPRSHGGGMNGYNFTERVRRVLAMAREEAARLHHEYVGSEHILLGLVREGEGVAAAALQNLGVETDGVRASVERVVKRGRAEVSGPDLPYTSRAKKVLELAMSEARELNHSYVGTEHLLLGLLRAEKGIAAMVLAEHGATVDGVRAEVRRLLGQSPSWEQGAQAAGGAGHRGDDLSVRRRRRIGGVVPAEQAARGAHVDDDEPQAPIPLGEVGERLAEATLLERIASARRAQAEADRVEEETTWLRVRGIVDLCERLQTPVRLAVAPETGLTLVIADSLRIVVAGTAGDRGPGTGDQAGARRSRAGGTSEGTGETAG